MEKVAVLACLLLLATAASAAGVDVDAVITDVFQVVSAVGAVATAGLLIHAAIVGLRFMKREVGSYQAAVGATASAASGAMSFSTKHAMWQEGIGIHDQADSLALARRSDNFTHAELVLADKLQARGMTDAEVVSALEARSSAMRRAGG